MNKFGIFIMLLLITIGGAHADRITLSLLYPISTNRSKVDSTNVGLSLLQNSLGRVNGVHLSGISAVSWNNVTGVQAAVLYSQIYHDLKGISIATVNVVNKNVVGIQVSYAANLLAKSVVGYQMSGVINFVGGNLKGVQQSAVFNVVGKSFKGVQTAGAGNVVGEDFKGLQFCISFNFVGKTMRGIQSSAFNVCGELHGMQLGYGNIAQINHGWQIGLFNLAEIQQGIPIGLINISDDGNVSWQNYFSNYANFVTAVSFVSNNFVSSLEVGIPEFLPKYEDSFLLGFHYGYRLPIRKFGLQADLGYLHTFIDIGDENSNRSDVGAIQFRLAFSKQVSKWLNLFAGFGNSITISYETTEKSENRLLYFAGINLF